MCRFEKPLFEGPFYSDERVEFVSDKREALESIALRCIELAGDVIDVSALNILLGGKEPTETADAKIQMAYIKKLEEVLSDLMPNLYYVGNEPEKGIDGRIGIWRYDITDNDI